MSPISMDPFWASTFTLTRPLWASFALPSPASPNRIPGRAETTPATRVSYGWAEGRTRLFFIGSITTTVPEARESEVGTHSATSWYWAAILVPVTVPSNVALPTTWSFDVGLVVPMPTLPSSLTENTSESVEALRSFMRPQLLAFTVPRHSH